MRRPTRSRRDFLRDAVSLLAALPIVGWFLALTRSSIHSRIFSPVPLSVENNILTSGDLTDGAVVTAKSRDQTVFVVVDDQKIRALSARCPHMGCSLHWVSDKEQFSCGCHGAVFTKTGTRIEGPSSSDMTSLNVRISNDKIYLDGNL